MSIPFIYYCIPVWSFIGSQIHILEDKDRERVAKRIIEVIIFIRPNLRGASIGSYHYDHSLSSFVVQVIHPSLRVSVRHYYLDLCEVCGEDIQVGSMLHHKSGTVFCSERCVSMTPTQPL